MRDLPEHIRELFQPPKEEPVRTGRRKRPEWAQSNIELARRILGPKRIEKLRRSLEKLKDEELRADRLRELVSGEMMHRFNVASLYFGENRQASEIAEMTGKSTSSIKSIMSRLARAVTAPRPVIVRDAVSTLAEFIARTLAEELEQAVNAYEKKLQLAIDGYQLSASGLRSANPEVVKMAQNLLLRVEVLRAELQQDRQHLDELQAQLESWEPQPVTTN